MSATPFPFDDTPPSQSEPVHAEPVFDRSLELDDDMMLDLALPPDTPLESQLLIDSLLDEGFTWADALNLLRLRERVIEHPDLQEHPYMLFAQWLYAHGQISEDLDCVAVEC